MMKRLFTMVVVALMATMSAYAQVGYSDTKHELAGSLGALSTSQWVDIFEEVSVILVTGAEYEDESFTGPVSVEYFYRAKNWLGIGGIFVLGQNSQNILVNKEKLGDLKHTYYTLMPAVKFDWLRKKNFGMYSKLGIGATLRTEKDNLKDKNHMESDSEVHVNWQASLIGIEAGSPYVRGFLELGAGEQGTALIGLRCKF